MCPGREVLQGRPHLGVFNLKTKLLRDLLLKAYEGHEVLPIISVVAFYYVCRH